MSIFAGSAFALAGDSSGTFADFPFVYFYNGVLRTVSAGTNFVLPRQQFLLSYDFSTICILPYSLTSGTFSFNDHPFSPESSDTSSFSSYTVLFFDVTGAQIGNVMSISIIPSASFSIPVGTRFITVSSLKSTNTSSRCIPGNISYTNVVYELSSGGSGSGDDLSQDILDGVEAIAQSLLDLETGPYTTTSGVSLNSNGVVTPTTLQQATLAQLLSLIGASSTYSGLVLEQMNLNFGNYFDYYETSDSTSGTVTVVRNLPAYVNAVGSELTDGINKLQRDNLLLYQQGENIEDALYTDKSDNQPWSVAQWLKDIYTAITSFFSSFWSPAETDLKTAAEDGMQAAADNGNAASGSQVDEVNSAADAFKSFGSTGNIGSGDVMDIFSDGASYDFFSQTTKDNLAYHPPAGFRRNLRSSSGSLQSDQSEEEYVDELDDKLSYWREVLGLP